MNVKWRDRNLQEQTCQTVNLQRKKEKFTDTPKKKTKAIRETIRIILIRMFINIFFNFCVFGEKLPFPLPAAKTPRNVCSPLLQCRCNFPAVHAHTAVAASVVADRDH